MALNLLSKGRSCEDIPGRYRYEAESFAWSLICLCLATVKGKDGKNATIDPHPMRRWFRDRETSRKAKTALWWDEHDHPKVPLVYPNAKALAEDLYEYWLNRYRIQTRNYSSRLCGILGLGPEDLPPPYEEPDDETVFRELHRIYFSATRPLEMTQGVVLEMVKRYMSIDRSD